MTFAKLISGSPKLGQQDFKDQNYDHSGFDFVTAFAGRITLTVYELCCYLITRSSDLHADAHWTVKSYSGRVASRNRCYYVKVFCAFKQIFAL